MVAAEETVTSVRSTTSSTSNGGASVTTTTTTSTSRFGRLFGWGGGATEAAAVEEETTTMTVTTTAIAEAPLQQHEDGVGSPTSGGSRPPSLRGAGTGSGTGSGSKRRTLSFLGPTASGTGAVGLPSEAHKEVFAALRAKVEKEAAEDNVAPFNSQDYLNRVLVARNLDVDAAFKMWQVRRACVWVGGWVGASRLV